MSEPERLRQLFLDAEQRRSDFDDRITKEIAFGLDSDHYADDQGNQKAPNRVKPKGRQTNGAIVHQAGQYRRSKLHVSVIATRYGVDSALATAAKSLISNHLIDPVVRLDEIREMCAMGALAARQWGYRWEYDPPSRRILCSLVDGRRMRWASGYHTPHDPRCPWFYYTLRIGVDECQQKRGWKNTSKLTGDDGGETLVARSNLPSGAVDLTTQSDPAERPSQVFRFSTICFLYERDRKVETRKEKPGSQREVPPEDQHLACMNMDGQGCGYKSQTAQELVDQGMYDSIDQMPQDAPDQGPAVPNGCPDCGNDLHLVTHTVTDLVTEHKDQLTIFAPNESGGPVILYQGPWPHGTQTLPVVIYTNQLHPTKVMGQSVTSLSWTLQVGANLVMRMGLEHMLLARPYMQIPEGACDYMGRRWEFGEEQGLGIYTRAISPPGSISVLQAPGLPPAWATLRAAYDGELRQDMGTTDYALSPEQTRDIPVGTKVIQQQEGEIPIVAKTERWQFEDGVGLQHVYELMQGCYTDEDLVQILGADGVRVAAMLRASDLPPMQVTITTDPNAVNIAGDQIDGLLKIAKEPRPIRKFLARRFGVNPADLEQLEKDEDEFAKSQAMPAGPGAPGAPGGIPPEIAAQVSGGIPTNGTGGAAPVPAMQ